MPFPNQALLLKSWHRGLCLGALIWVLGALVACLGNTAGGTSVDTETVALQKFPGGGPPSDQSSGNFAAQDMEVVLGATKGDLRIDSVWLGGVLRTDTIQYWELGGSGQAGKSLTYLQAMQVPHIWERRSRLWAGSPQQGNVDPINPKQAQWSARLWARGTGPGPSAEGMLWYRQSGEWDLGPELGVYVLDSLLAWSQSGQIAYQGSGRFVDRAWTVNWSGRWPWGVQGQLSGPLRDSQGMVLGTLVWDSTGMRLRE